MYYVESLLETCGMYGLLIGGFLLIAGILILIFKNRDTKFLGFWLLFEGLSHILTTPTHILFMHRSWLDHQAGDIGTVLTVVKVLLSFVSVLFFLLYPYVHYRSKAVFPVAVLKCIQIVIVLFASDLLYSEHFHPPLYDYLSVIDQIAAEMYIMVAISLITFLAFFKHREEEKILKKIYRVPLFQLVCSSVAAFNWILAYTRVNAASLFMIIVFSIGCVLCSPIAAIYILWKAPGKKMYNSPETEGSNG